MKTSVCATIAVLTTCIGCQSTPASDAPGRVAEFEVRHEILVTPAAGAKELRMWVVLPQEDALQSVSELKIETPLEHRTTTDSEGNHILYLSGTGPFAESIPVVATFALDRKEQQTDPDPDATRPLEASERQKMSHYLASNRHVKIDDSTKALAAQIVGDEKNPVRAARKIYDWKLVNIDYWVNDPANKKASPVGSSEYCLTTRTGNCTDLHSLYASLTRSAGIPTRILYGSFLKKELDGQDVDQSYHCWIEFWAPEIGWIPLDVAVADIFDGPITITPDNETLVRRTTAAGYTGPDALLVDYYFGTIEERRVLWTVGRDLELEPRPAAGTVHALPKAYVEIDGQPVAEKAGWTRKLTYHEVVTIGGAAPQ